MQTWDEENEKKVSQVGVSEGSSRGTRGMCWDGEAPWGETRSEEMLFSSQDYLSTCGGCWMSDGEEEDV